MQDTSLDALLKVYGPFAVAGGAARKREDLTMRTGESELQKLVQDMEMRKAKEGRDAEMHPLDMQAKQATIGHTQAQTGGLQETTRGVRHTNDVADMVGVPAKAADARGVMDARAAEARRAEDADFWKNLPATVSATLAVQDPAKAREIFLNGMPRGMREQLGAGLPNDNTIFQVAQTFMKTYLDNQPKIAQTHIRENAATQRTNTTVAGRLTVAQLRAQVDERIANLRAAATRYSADKGAALRGIEKLNIDQQIVRLASALATEDDPEMRARIQEELSFLTTHQREIRQQSGPVEQQTVQDGQLVTTPRRTDRAIMPGSPTERRQGLGLPTAPPAAAPAAPAPGAAAPKAPRTTVHNGVTYTEGQAVPTKNGIGKVEWDPATNRLRIRPIK